MWNPLAFFEEMLKAFPAVTEQIQSGPQEDRHIEAARLGFAGFGAMSDWELADITDAELYVNRDSLTSEESEMAWYEEQSEAVGAFASFVIGGLIAKRITGTIDQAMYLSGIAVLPGFLSLDNGDIFRLYAQTLARNT